MDIFNLSKTWEGITKNILKNYNEDKTLHFLLENVNLESISKEKKQIILITKNKIDEVILNTDFHDIINNYINNYLKNNYELSIFYEKKYISKREEIENKFENTIKKELNFNNLIFSKKNLLIKNATLEISNNEFAKWNPLFIYGRSGLGKTHILHAIGNKTKENFQKKNIKYIEAKDFGNIVTKAMQSNNVNNEVTKINNQFEKYDLLLIDDIQFIKSRRKTKEVFFNIFNYFIQNKKQIVITSDQDPIEIKDFEERFITRFNGGLLLKITPPDLEASSEIIKIKIENNENIKIENFDIETITWISENFGQNVRSLEGALNRISLFNIYNNNEKITIEYLKEIFKDNLYKFKKIKNETIINVVAKYFGISKKDLISKTRKKDIILPRNICIYLIKNINDLPLTEIGKIFQRDHTTIINSLNKIKKDFNKDKQIIHTISTIKKKLFY